MRGGEGAGGGGDARCGQHGPMCIRVAARDELVIALFRLLQVGTVFDWAVAVLEELLVWRPAVFNLALIRRAQHAWTSAGFGCCGANAPFGGALGRRKNTTSEPEPNHQQVHARGHGDILSRPVLAHLRLA